MTIPTSALNDPRWTKLPNKRQNGLLEEHRYSEVHAAWWDSTYDWFKEKCNEQGIVVDEVYFSGFYSQGDGACFEGWVHSWATLLPLIKREAWLTTALDESWRLSIRTSQRYSHSGTMSTSFTAELAENPYDEEEELLQHSAWGIANPLTQADLDALEEDILRHCRDLADEAYRALEEEYDHLTSDETVVGWILDNLDDDELRDPDEEYDCGEQEDSGDEQVDHSRQLELF